MQRLLLTLFCLLAITAVYPQKKPLDHSVYDGWQSIGERMISNNGKWAIYAINPQEGDNELVIQSTDGLYKKVIPRGYNALVTEDSRFAILKIKPLFKESREARIKKKRPDEMPKDSFAIVELGRDSVWKIPRVKSFKTPSKEAGWLAWQLEKPVDKKESAAKSQTGEKKVIDSLSRMIDSLRLALEKRPLKKRKNEDEVESNAGSESRYEMLFESDAEGDEPPAAATDAGSELVIRNLNDGQDRSFPNVLEYFFSEKGNKLVIEQAKSPRDSMSKPTVSWIDLATGNTHTISKGGNEFKNFSFSEDGSQLAYLAERDARPKELQKFYKVWYYKPGMDSAVLLVDKNTVGMKLGMTVSEFGNLSFSKNGQRLFFGTVPVQPPKDTSLVEIDLVKLDVWHYKDDYLQTQQLSRLQRDLQTNYLAVCHLASKQVRQLGSKEIPTIIPTAEGDGDQFAGITDFGKRVEGQWAGNTRKDIYVVNVNSGEKKLVKKDMLGVINAQYISPRGTCILWYDSKARHYFAWNGDSIRNISRKIKTALWDEEHDSPSDPPPYGVMGWHEGDSAVYVYDRYDVHRLDPSGKKNPLLVTRGMGRKEGVSFRYIPLDTEKKFFNHNNELLFRSFDNKGKGSGLRYFSVNGIHYATIDAEKQSSNQLGNLITVPSKGAGNVILYTLENYKESPDLFFAELVEDYHQRQNDATGGLKINLVEKKLSDINQQQDQYNWGSAELYKWKAFNGKIAEGILYKPGDFDPNKKYPLILYFYETHTNNLHDYIPPTPTGSRLNISFFVSRGYLVFSPDIHYSIGHPAKSAYNYVVSAAKDLAKNKWVDAKNIGIQGQSWGGIQVAQLVTMTDMFKAAWAGAPVANMTSAYGGIRWESGANRQFQYEKTQSRIGATLWEKPQLYIENSPLFHLPKVKTPLVIMHNDADGAVPWYQGIELFTAMRRLGKKVWLLNYNGEAHNLVERKNKKDIQVREQQYFDWLLKAEKPPKWIVEGIPAVKKGRDWGLELVD